MALLPLWVKPNYVQSLQLWMIRSPESGFPMLMCDLRQVFYYFWESTAALKSPNSEIVLQKISGKETNKQDSFIFLPNKLTKMEEDGKGMKVATDWTHKFLSKNKKPSYVQDMLRMNDLLKTTRRQEVSWDPREKQLVPDIKYASIIFTLKDSRTEETCWPEG